MPKKQLVGEALIDLHRRLSALPSRSHDRRIIMRETATLYGVSEQTLYRALAERARPRALRRSDRGTPRVLPQDKMESYCEVIAAIKVRTSNKKGRHLSTGEAIRLIEEFGVETPDGVAKAPKSMLKKTTVNRYLRQWGYDRETLRRQTAAVRFQAEHSNDCWQFDLSPSDLKEVKEPLWLQASKGAPTLMLFSVVDDRSGVVVSIGSLRLFKPILRVINSLTTSIRCLSERPRRSSFQTTRTSPVRRFSNSLPKIGRSARVPLMISV